ncbi:hypothetical protein [Aliarcobacter butzleri]|uniref:hypothetical protein n=1 Tax=Aliarcobacter butzleri TaxID=28197 RepID=UPI0021B32B07|nr:hypothetical protein [Aliarcobacter butzleri]MCT7647522.1 hypothetical protein [Aliarcobacter butzleri]
MSAAIYKQLEKLVLPNLINFKEDLTRFDKEVITRNKGVKFLYAYRDTGTNIVMLDKRRFIKTSKEDLEKSLQNGFDILKGHNKAYLYFNGETINQIDFENLCSIYGMFAKEVRAHNELIANLNLDLIALDLYCLMRDFKTSWRSKAVNSDVDSRRRFRNHFDINKIKIPAEFKYISNYADLKDSEEIKDIKEQLIANLI